MKSCSKGCTMQTQSDMEHALEHVDLCIDVLHVVAARVESDSFAGEESAEERQRQART